MNFYNNTHPFYCGIDLHARTLYVCIIDHQENTCLYQPIPANKVNLKKVCAREQLRSTFSDPVVQRSIDFDMRILEHYAKQLSKLEWFLEQQAKQHNPVHYHNLLSVWGIGRILALTLIYEMGDINQFDSVQNFASYAHLVEWA